MPSPCVDNLLKPLTVSRPHSPSRQLTQAGGPVKDVRPALRSILLSLNKPLSQTLVNETIGSLVQLGRDFSTAEENFEETALNQAVLTKLVVGLYAEALDLCLTQAANAEAEAEWWRDVEYSRRNVAWYLLQTLPSRLLRVGRVVVEALRSHNIPITLANLSPSSLRQLFPSAGLLRPNLLMTACFPHLQHQPFSITSSLILYSPEHDVPHENFLNKVSAWLNYVLSLIKMPVELTRQECTFKRRELESLRDQKAEVLGRLAQMRGDLATILRDQPWNLQNFVTVLNGILRGEAEVEYKPSLHATQSGSAGALLEIAQYSKTVFETQASDHNQRLNAKQLLRPSRLTLLWPKLVLVPPLTFYALRSAYSNRASIWDVARDAQDTVRGFVKGWLVEPLKDVLKTVRAGGEDAMIIRKEGVNADFESLERMALALAKDELRYGPEQLAVLSAQIKQGDLTPILHLYEEDIKRPLTSALSGTLLRSVFIQVQKAKVDIDQALAGIDKLLRSQELTFAFVGVAPAFAIVYVLGTSLVSLWSGGRGKGKYGGRKNIGRVWYALRRTERLIVSQPGAHHNDSHDQDQNFRVHNAHDHSDSAISPVTAGLLLLSATRLRTYAERHLPARSRLREGFLEDVGDLENPDLGRSAKMRVVERMWRCWGEVLAFGSAGAEGASSR